MNDDLDYVYLAPATHWRGGRMYIEAAIEAAKGKVVLQLGCAEFSAAPKRLPARSKPQTPKT